MQNAIAFSNNDVITIAWSYGTKPTGCMGFAIYQIDEQGVEVLLPNKAVFKATTDRSDTSSLKFPIQKFYWKDVYARLKAERTGNKIFHYRIVPMEGKPGNFVPMTSFAPLLTNKVEISARVGDNMCAYFNRGLISTQRISKLVEGNLDVKSLREMAADYKGDTTLRDSLSGEMVEALTGFLKRAEKQGRIYAGLYELGDPQLKDELIAMKNKLSIILSNSVEKKDDLSKPQYMNKKGQMVYHQISGDANDKIRDQLRASGAEVYARVMPDGHIGHNKFLIYVDQNQVPQAVLFGSTNWTASGLCTQTNNTMVIDDEKLAKRYMRYWEKMVKDTNDAKGLKRNLQGEKFRHWNQNSETLSIGGSKLQSWFSPNTDKARVSGKMDELRPLDMAEVEKCINAAKHAVLFLAFYPGSPSIANWTAAALRNNKSLFVRGMVTNKSAAEGFYYGLVGGVPPKPGNGIPVKQDYRVGAADAFNGTKIPDGWKKEFLNAGFAIIHDKVMVIDPFSEDCIVITGSHNLGHKASYDNDENLAIIKGNKQLALAYATHVLDIYEHFAFRIAYKKSGGDAFLKDNSEEFLKKYFDEKGNIKNQQLKFWMDGAVTL